MALGNWCTECRKHHDDGKHSPLWEVWEEDERREDARTVRADDEEEAAEQFAEDDDCNSAEYRIVGGSPATVFVAKVDSEEITKWKVEGEAIPSYTARQLDGFEEKS